MATRKITKASNQGWDSPKPPRRARATRTPRASWPGNDPVWEKPALTNYQVNDDQG
ncbi:hypothetical protein ABZ281_25060 [Streptomyces sp. NPDC006265]|uniref:hypothetical protein n=1 Tax=Streptomyces sp. NPDC006265 TaxID=3156740 RepID=UPI0033B635E2